MDGHTLTPVDARRTARAAVEQIFRDNLFGAAEPAPLGTLRGIDVLPTARVTQKLSRAVQTIITARGEMPDLLSPKTFFEKLTIAKFFAPVPMPSPADKLGCRRFIPEPLRSKIEVIPPVWTGRRPITAALLDSLKLPNGRYFAKSNCGSGTNDDFTIPPTAEMLERLERFSTGWLERRHGVRAGEWWYDLIRPQIMIEPDFAPDPTVSLSDWKFHTGGGRVLAVQLDLDRSGAHRQLMFDRNFEFIPEEMFFKTGEPIEKPSNYDAAVELVEAIAKPFEYARVDLYLVKNRVYLGEITMAPIGGQRLPKSKRLDGFMGDVWRGAMFG